MEGRKSFRTERLLLRPWEESDAESLYEYARDPAVGPIAGWPPHTSVEESLNVIKNVLNGLEAYAVCLKTDGKAIGAIELKLNGHTDMTERDDECELGYWLGKPFWGRGIIPEAARELLRHAFEECGMKKVWCGYYDGNDKSRRVQEKCGFVYQWTSRDLDVPLLHEKRTGHVSCLSKEEYLKQFIAYCGLNCAQCDARIATVTNDEVLRARVAKEWSELNGVDITPDMIHCTGCRIDGVKTPYCQSLCPIRQCALGKDFKICSDCGDMNRCEKVGAIIGNNTTALSNLRG